MIPIRTETVAVGEAITGGRNSDAIHRPCGSRLIAVGSKCSGVYWPIFNMNNPRATTLRRIRWVLGGFILALVLSGLTAFPLQLELDRLTAWRGLDDLTTAGSATGLDRWILTVRDGLRDTYERYPWLAYGTDWLAFAHVVIAVFFLGPWKDPVRNVWVLWAGLIACGLVVPLALVCGAIQQIPFGWRLIDCSFGVCGAIPLGYCLLVVGKLEKDKIPTG